jgi:hypothetical protein
MSLMHIVAGSTVVGLGGLKRCASLGVEETGR